MRRIDKKLNMIKANLLAESRYMESKGLLKETMIPVSFDSGEHEIAFNENEDELEEGFFKNTIKKVKDFGNRVLDIPSKEEEAKKQQAIDEIIHFEFGNLFFQPGEGQVLRNDIAESMVDQAIKAMPTVFKMVPSLFEFKGGYFSNGIKKINGEMRRVVIPSCFEFIRGENDVITDDVANTNAQRRIIPLLG